MSSPNRVTIQIRCTQEERDNWESLARRNGYTLSSWARFVLNLNLEFSKDRSLTKKETSNVS